MPTYINNFKNWVHKHNDVAKRVASAIVLSLSVSIALSAYAVPEAEIIEQSKTSQLELIQETSADTSFQKYITEPKAEATPEPTPSPPNFKVCIDAGHGDSDPGAYVEHNGRFVSESHINLDIALRLQAILEREGVDVIMTRTTDEFLTIGERPELAMKENADAYISVHNNLNDDTSIRGTMILYRDADINDDDEYGATTFAEILLESITKSLGTKNQAIHSGNGFAMSNRNMQMPAVIVECAFMSNPAELENLLTEEFRQLAAEGIAEGILQLRDSK